MPTCNWFCVYDVFDYLSMQISAQKSQLLFWVWQVKLGQLLRVQGRLTVFNNQIQITVSSLREAITH